jgi:nucleoside-diphosphate-sugar epimerase
MKVLLTGGSGFIGSHVLAALQDEGVEVVVIGRSRLPGAVRQIEADLLTLTQKEINELLRKECVTHLLHLAWVAEHGKYWTSPLNLRWVDATVHLVDAFCAAGGQHAVIAGTCAEYDWSYGYCREESTPLRPTTLYGAAKDATRRLVTKVCEQREVSCAWGRVFLPFGYGEANNRLIPSLIEVFLGKREPYSVNIAAFRDFLHVSDVAAGFLRLLTSKTGGEFNISSGIPTPITEVVTVLADLLGADPQLIFSLSSERLDEPVLIVGENLKLKALGWQPNLRIQQGFERMVNERLS